MHQRLIRFFTLLIIWAMPAQAEIFSGLYAKMGGEWNSWFPSEASNLSYQTEGLQNFYMQAGWRHCLPFVPKPSWHWETNFGASHQQELLQAQSSSTAASKSFDAIQTGFERLGIDAGINFDEVEQDWDASRPLDERRKAIPDLELSYRKEVFWIGVTPSESDLVYAAYGSNKNYIFPQGVQASQVTRFQELRLTFPTGGWEILFLLMNAMLFASSSSNTYDKPLQFESMQTRLGIYYATYALPFSTTSVVTDGTTSGDDQLVYDAHFRSWGLVEEIKTLPDEKNMIFNLSLKMGVASVKLRKDESLDIETSPLFLDLGAGLELGYRFNLTDHLSLPIWGSAQASSFWGVTSDSTADKLQLNSFIGSNAFLQMKGALEWHF